MTMAPWIAEMVGDLPALLRARVSEDLDAIVARRRREALRVWLASVPPLYPWARLDHALFASRVKLERIPNAPPRARSVVLFGHAGVGKTTLAVALLRLRVEHAIAKHPFDSDDDVGSMGFANVLLIASARTCPSKSNVFERNQISKKSFIRLLAIPRSTIA